MTTSKNAPRRGGMVRNFIHLGLGQIASTLLSMLLAAAVSRVLGPADYGVLGLVIAISTFAWVVIDWGYGAVIVREAARDAGRSGNLLGTGLALRTVCALLACPVVFVVALLLLRYDLLTCVLASAAVLTILPQSLGLSFGWVFRARERMDRDAQLNVLLKLATWVGCIICLALGGRLAGLVFTWLVAGCLTLLIAIVMYRSLHLPGFSVTRSTARELLRDGAPMFAMSLATAVEPFFNYNILYKLAGPQTAGWYNAAWSIAGTLVAPAAVLSTAMYPRLAAAAGSAAEFRRAFDVSLRPLLLLATLAAAGTYLFADVPIALINGREKFGPAADTLRAFAPVLLLLYVDMFFTVVILALGKAGRLAGAKVASVVLTTGLAIVLVPICQARFSNGGLGVMHALVAGELLMAVASVVLVREAVDDRVIGDIFRSLAAGAATVLLFELLPAFTPFLGIPLCVLAFAVLSWLVGAVRRSDIDVLLASFRKSPPVQG